MNVFIVGTGGFAREAATLIHELGQYDTFAGFIDVPAVAEKFRDQQIMERTVLSQVDFKPEMGEVVIAVGDPATREKIASALPEGTQFATLIHPTATVSKWSTIGAGSIICAGCIVTTQIKLGLHAQLNLQTTIGHDCVIDDFFTTAPSANISGECKIGKRVYFGTGAAVRQGIKIHGDVTVGMGAMVVKNLEASGTYVGIPAKRIK
ncbi:acetyltransferase [Neolewinella antarctica]|uniref:Sugar O-acyltransferase (Sialic acid O-acetyltransferase NeuD family) n=1 Tax=Neolewinella antarctica TaxID=442734 RepID=A0ABX0XA57_9BACT|nr:acetyltransferase [Neolewinella antarctica]NJC26130.1 sugar O-acyltransferase (sialic acid O-acetyltransferase NeuD family) [Neolewinella antarctica]